MAEMTLDLMHETPDLDLGIEELDEMLEPWNWDDFFGGVSIGIGLVGLYAGGAALAT
ncbi:MAG TPA: hypothetical protein VH418_02405 [Solirubrobacteraceae bacterium]|jgi:hypothetical protein